MVTNLHVRASQSHLVPTRACTPGATTAADMSSDALPFPLSRATIRTLRANMFTGYSRLASRLDEPDNHTAERVVTSRYSTDDSQSSE